MIVKVVQEKESVDVTIVEKLDSIWASTLSKDPDTNQAYVRSCEKYLNMSNKIKCGLTFYEALKTFNFKEEPPRFTIFFGWRKEDEVKIGLDIRDNEIVLSFSCRMI